ncbi:MAG: PIN domain-containing protein [Actinobacteria bacterium]|nr:PIN domain-containing protein [Actinomycetota bacterium]MCL5987273.1 PIN domain-containing protein [Actinomycetota bacterium]
MIIIDTSVWIEFLKRNENVFSIMREKVEKQQVLAVECVFGELLQGAKDIKERKIIVDYWKNLPKIEESGIWIEAGFYSGENGLYSKGVGLIDSVLIVLARRTNSDVWTFDKKLLNVLEDSLTFSM